MYDNDARGSGHRGRRRARPRRAGLLAVALALIGLLATACGGGPPRAKGAAGGVEGALAYARCMRAHGVPDFPDPNSNGQFNVDPHSVSSQQTAANHVCHHLLTAGRQANAAQQQHMLGQLVKYAQCMRAHGVPNFPDPQTTSGGIGEHPGMGFDTSGIDPNNPQVRAANQACQHLAKSAKG